MHNNVFVFQIASHTRLRFVFEVMLFLANFTFSTTAPNKHPAAPSKHPAAPESSCLFLVFLRYTGKPLSGNWCCKPKSTEKSSSCKFCKDLFSESVRRREAGDGLAAVCEWCASAQRKLNWRNDMLLSKPDGSRREDRICQVVELSKSLRQAKRRRR